MIITNSDFLSFKVALPLMSLAAALAFVASKKFVLPAGISTLADVRVHMKKATV